MSDCRPVCVLAAFLFTVIPGCESGQQKPEQLIPEDTYIDLIVELQLIRSYHTVTPPDSAVTDSLKRMVYDKYGVTEEQFINSHNYYQNQFKEQQKRITEAIERLKEENFGSDEVGVDTLDIRSRLKSRN